MIIADDLQRLRSYALERAIETYRLQSGIEIDAGVIDNIIAAAAKFHVFVTGKTDDKA